MQSILQSRLGVWGATFYHLDCSAVRLTVRRGLGLEGLLGETKSGETMRNAASHGVDRNGILLSRRQLVAGALAAAVTFGMLAVSALAEGNGAAPNERSPFGVLRIGAAEADLTPGQPVALHGQFNLRVSQKADTPITASVVALESREGVCSLDAAVMVSCDLVAISDLLLGKVRQATRKRLPDLDVKKVFLSATHTHTAPVTYPGVYDIPKTGVMQVEDYCDFAAERIAEAIEKAWKGRQPGSFTFGLAHAAVAENRRAIYADGRAVMYGKTGQPNFRGLEGFEDHDVGTLFFWNDLGKLVAMAVNVSCPSQEVEGLSTLNADFWHPVRESLRKRYGQDVCVLGWTGASGDLSPHLMYRKSAEERMRQLRRTDAIGRTCPADRRRGGRKLRDSQERPAFRRSLNSQGRNAPTADAARDRRGICRGESRDCERETDADEKPLAYQRLRRSLGTLREAEDEPATQSGNGDPCAAHRRCGRLHQHVGAVHRLRRSDESPQPGDSDVRHSIGRRRDALLFAHGESRSRRRL